MRIAKSVGTMAGAALFALLFGLAGRAEAALMVTLEDFTGADAEATLEIEQMGDALKFTATIIVPAAVGDGDIRAVWFNVADDSLIAGLVASGADVTGSGTSLASDANLTPKSFDFGVQIGGAGDDDIKSTMFTLVHTTLALDLNTFFESEGDTFGMRIKSIEGDPDSSKLIDSPPGSEVPEPSALLIIGAVFAATSLIRRRRPA